MKHNKLLLGAVLFSVLGLLFLYMAGAFTTKLPEQLTETKSDISQLKTMQLSTQEVQERREFTASVSAEQKAILSARLTARIAGVLVDVGDEVKQGDLLIRLESSDLNARVNQTEQALSSAQAQLNVARKEFKRAKALMAKKLIPQSQYDQAESQLKTANANFKQAKATVNEAETTYGYSVITAPFDGVIDKRFINMGDTASPGMQLLSLYNPSSLQLEANISESLVSKAMLGELLQYTLPNLSIAGEGAVVEVSPATDNSSRSFLIKIALANSDKLYPGNFAKIWVNTELVEQLIVPEQAVYQVGQLDYVKVIENEQVKTKLVQLAEHYQVRKGLKVGELVVLNPLD